jgi:hypothetical protein
VTTNEPLGLADAWKAFERTRDRADCDAVAVRLTVSCDPRPAAAEHGIAPGWQFGMQDRGNAVYAGVAIDGERWEFQIGVVAKRNRSTGEVRFVGPFAHGTAGDEFLYLNWRPETGTGWAMRIKMPLTPLCWEQLVEADAAGTSFHFDATGRAPHYRRQVEWQSG